jgi:hypothetical protein
MTQKKYSRKQSDFFAKYKHPKWQKKRLEVMEAKNFECECCGDKETTLNVHHKYYVNGRDPWEYEDVELECLCERCHSLAHEDEQLLKETINQWKVGGGFDPAYLSGFISGWMCREGTSGFDRYKPISWEWISGFVRGYGLLDDVPSDTMLKRMSHVLLFITDGMISESDLLYSLRGEQES